MSVCVWSWEIVYFAHISFLSLIFRDLIDDGWCQNRKISKIPTCIWVKKFLFLLSNFWPSLFIIRESAHSNSFSRFSSLFHLHAARCFKSKTASWNAYQQAWKLWKNYVLMLLYCIPFSLAVTLIFPFMLVSRVIIFFFDSNMRIPMQKYTVIINTKI